MKELATSLLLFLLVTALSADGTDDMTGLDIHRLEQDQKRMVAEFTLYRKKISDVKPVIFVYRDNAFLTLSDANIELDDATRFVRVFKGDPNESSEKGISTEIVRLGISEQEFVNQYLVKEDLPDTYYRVKAASPRPLFGTMEKVVLPILLAAQYCFGFLVVSVDGEPRLYSPSSYPKWIMD